MRVAERAEPDPPPAADPYGAREGDDGLTAALAQASDTDRELLLLAYWDDLSRSDIATVLGISVGAVDTRLHRARQRLRQRLAAANPHQDPADPAKEKDHAER
ncbi:sigma-70 region 4 domain-containing protein [Streptomyces sp. NPDC020766]